MTDRLIEIAQAESEALRVLKTALDTIQECRRERDAIMAVSGRRFASMVGGYSGVAFSSVHATINRTLATVDVFSGLGSSCPVVRPVPHYSRCEQVEQPFLFSGGLAMKNYYVARYEMLLPDGSRCWKDSCGILGRCESCEHWDTLNTPSEGCCFMGLHDDPFPFVCCKTGCVEATKTVVSVREIGDLTDEELNVFCIETKIDSMPGFEILEKRPFEELSLLEKLKQDDLFKRLSLCGFSVKCQDTAKRIRGFRNGVITEFQNSIPEPLQQVAGKYPETTEPTVEPHNTAPEPLPQTINEYEGMELVPVKEAAKRLGIKPETLATYRSGGTKPDGKKSGKDSRGHLWNYQNGRVGGPTEYWLPRIILQESE